MVIYSPFVSVFSFFQILNVGKYLLNKRIDSLKDLTWGFFDDRNSKNLKKLSEEKTEGNKKRKSTFKKENSSDS